MLENQETANCRTEWKRMKSLVASVLTGTPSRTYIVLPPFCFYLLDKEILCFISRGFLGTSGIELILFHEIDLRVFEDSYRVSRFR